MKPPKGFTLLEIIIAVAILSFISIYTAQSIRSGVRAKVKISNTIEKDSLIRDALKVIADDVSKAFNYRDINIELYNKAQDVRKERAAKKSKKKNDDKNDDNNNENDDNSGNEENNQVASNENDEKNKNKFLKKQEVILTQFMGKKDEIHFTSRSYFRTRENSPYSDQAEVGYFLKRCRNRVNKEQQSECLWRRITPIIDDKVDEGGDELVLLENVTDLKFRYLGPGSEEDWRHDWLSGEGGDAITKDKFPYAVEITIEVQNKNIPNEKALAMTAVAAISYSNNPEDRGEDGQDQTQTQQ